MDTFNLIDTTLWVVVGIMWVSVAVLVTDNFNQFTDNKNDWYKLPLWVRFPIVLFAPILFIWWSDEIWSQEPPPKITD